MYDVNPIPIKFIDSLDTRRHVALLYEDAEYARFIEFRFIRNGLAKGEQCVYATEQDSGSIVLKMLRYGIPLECFERNELRVFQVHRTCGDRDEILKNCRNDLKTILSGLKRPFRVVSRIVSDVSTITGMSIELELEHEAHECFDDFGGSVICPYYLPKIEPSKRKEWLAELRENHHEVIYAPKFGGGGVLSN